MTDIAHPDITPRASSFLIALRFAAGDTSSAQLELVELIAWLAFDKPKQSEVHVPPVKVLVVDGCTNAAHVECVLFSHLGHTAVSVRTGREAIAMTSMFHPDVVMLDLDVRNVDGREVAHMIRERRCGAYIVGVSGWCDYNDRSRALAAGCNVLVSKPIDLAKIRGLLINLGPR